MPSNGSTRIALIQASVTETKQGTIEKALIDLDRAAEQGAKIICFQELFSLPYFCQEEVESAFGLAEEIPGPTTNQIADRARDLGVVVIAPIFEKAAPGIYFNSAAVIDADGSLLGVYRKMHIPDDPQFHEKYYFTPGDSGFRSWETRFGPIGVCICWDQWFPEAARLTALNGAGLIFYPTAIGWIEIDREEDIGQEQLSAWETMQRSHAIANGCFVAAVNRVGVEESESGEKIAFWGRSFVANPAGKVIARAGDSENEALLADIDFSEIERQRIQWPFFRDRRIDVYSGLLDRIGNQD